MGFIDLKPPFGESFPAREYSFSLGLFVYHCIFVLETAMCKADFGGGGKICPIPTLLTLDMSSISPEVFCLLSYRQFQGP